MHPISGRIIEVILSILWFTLPEVIRDSGYRGEGRGLSVKHILGREMSQSSNDYSAKGDIAKMMCSYD